VNEGEQYVHCAVCPADFTYIPVVNGCYKVVNQNLGWLFAGAACRTLHPDAYLLIINSAEEQLAVSRMLDVINSTGPKDTLFFLKLT